VSLANEFKRGVDALYTAAGVTGTYTPQGGTGTDYTVIVSYDLTNLGESVEVGRNTVSLSIRTSDLSDPPRRGDTFTVGSDVFRVDSVVTSDELEHTVLAA